MADDFDWSKYRPTPAAAPAAASDNFDWSKYQASPPAIDASAASAPAPAPAAPPANAKPQLEFADAPTIANMPIPGAMDKDFSNSSWGDVLAAKFGPYFTDDPLARQKILAKNLPGAKAVNDKFGNPMVEYKGEKYYTSRPGEFDATDLTSGVVRSSAALPIAAAAVPAAELAGGGTLAYMGANALAGGAASVGEDVLANKAGGENQVNLKKAGVNAAASALIPLALQKAVMPAAGYVAEKFANATGKGLLVDPLLGTVTKEGQQLFARAGIDPSQFTADQLAQIQSKVLRSFGSPDVARQTANQVVGQEFGVPLTTGQMTGDIAQRAAEDQMRQGGKGTFAQSIIKNADEAQGAALNQAQQTLRSKITGAAQPMDQNQIGEALQTGFKSAKTTAADLRNQAYSAAFDPEKLAQAGISPDLDMKQVATVGQRVRQSLTDGSALPNNNEPIIIDRRLTPAAASGLKVVDDFSKGKLVNLAAPTDAAWGGAPKADEVVGGMTWRGVDQTRKYLNALYGAAGSDTDKRAMSAVIRAFDNEVMNSGSPILSDSTQLARTGVGNIAPVPPQPQPVVNPLLQQARSQAAEYLNTYKPQYSNATSTNTGVKVLSNDNVSGNEVFNKIFGSSFKKGEAQQVVNNLQTIFANNPDGMRALKEGGLQRLFMDAQGQPLGERAIAKNINQALTGPQSELYASLYSPDELARLKRFGTLAENVGSAKQRINGSGTAYPILNMLRSLAPKGIGAGIGAGVGQFFGYPEAGAVAGGYVGNTVGAGLNALAANRAVAGALPARRMPYAPMILGTSAIPGLLGQ